MVGKLQKNKLKYLNHSEEINEIITAVPPVFLHFFDDIESCELYSLS